MISNMIWIRFLFAPGFNDQEAVAAGSILRLIPLQFFITHKACFIPPFFGVWWAILVEFIGPYQFVMPGGVVVVGLAICCKGDETNEQNDLDVKIFHIAILDVKIGIDVQYNVSTCLAQAFDLCWSVSPRWGF